MGNYVVIGLGRFGQSVAKTLYKNNQIVLGIDEKEEIVQSIVDNEYIEDAIILNATDEKSMKKIIKDNFDTAFVCIGHDLQASILVTLILKEMGLKKIICKAQNRIQGKVLEKIGADKVIYPEETMGETIAIQMLQPNITEYFKFSENYSIIEFEAKEEFINKSLIELDLRNKYEINVIGIKSENGEMSVNFKPQYIIENGDTLLALVNLEKFRKFNKIK